MSLPTFVQSTPESADRHPSRRAFLGAAATIAAAGAAGALPTVATAQAATARPKTPCACYPPAPIVGPGRAEMERAWQVLTTSGPEVREAANVFEAELAQSWLSERALFIAAFARHFPGLEYVVRLAGEHVSDSSTETFDCDCFD